MKILEGKKKVNLVLEYLFMKNKKDEKNQKGARKVEVEILMVLEEDQNLENISNVITTTRLAT